MRRWCATTPLVSRRAHCNAWQAAKPCSSSFANSSSLWSTSLVTVSSSTRLIPGELTLSYMSALHHSRVLRRPFMPLVVRSAEVAEALHGRNSNNNDSRHDRNSSSSAVGSTVVHELAVLPMDELVQRVHRFSRTNFDAAQRPLLYAHLREVMKPQRMAQMPIKALQDYLHLAHVAGLHETCLEVYHAAREHMAPPALSLHSKGPLTTVTGASASDVSGGNGTRATTGDASTAATTGSGNLLVDSAVLVSNFVVDSAYAMQSSAELTRIASYCVSQLLSASSSTAPQPLPPPQANTITAGATKKTSSPEVTDFARRSPQETVVEVSLVRCLWRTICLAEFYRCTEASGTGGVRGNAEQALADALAILEACVRVAAARRKPARRETTALPNEALDRSGRVDTSHMKAEQLSDLLRKGIHFVRYASVGDDGEFAFFEFCKEKGILTAPQPLPQSRLGGSFLSLDALNDSSGAAGVAPSLIYDADEVQVFYGSLIETCSAGQLVAEAMLYFTEARRLLGCDPLADEEDNSAEVLMVAAAAETRVGEKGRIEGLNSKALPSHSAQSLLPSTLPPLPQVYPAPAHGAPAPPPAPPTPSSTATSVATAPSVVLSPAAATPPLDGPRITRSEIFTDFLIHRLLFTLQAAKDNRRIVRLARALIAAGAAESIKVNLWTLLLISAGETKAADVVLFAHAYARRQLSAVGGSAGGSGTGGGNEAGGWERRTWEYLLQTSLNALSKCQLPHFEQDYLLPAQECGVLHCTDEFYYGCLLQDAHNSMDPVQRAAKVLTRMEEGKVVLTAPLISRLLKLYLRAEAADFLTVYQHAAAQLHLRRVLWTDQLVLWADRRRYFLTQEERSYIVDEVLRSRNVTDVPRLLPLLGGLRAQFALLYYDFTHNARERFLLDGTLHADAPTMQDSRAHFLTTRALSVQRGIMAPAGGGSRVCEQHARYRSSVNIGEGVLEDTSDWTEDDPSAVTVEAMEEYNAPPRVLGDNARRTLHAAIAELSEVPLLLPTSDDTSGSESVISNDEERLHDEALRVYLADVLGGLQRSLNSVA